MKKQLLFLATITLGLFGYSQKSQISLPINWDDTANVDYTVIDFGGDSSLLDVDPNNAANIVLKSIKTAGAQTWAGTVLGNDSLSAAIPFSAGNTIMRARVYSPTAGITVRMKVENESNGAISVETDATTSVVGWDTLSFDFANNVSGTPAINFSNTYDKIAMFYNFGVSPMADETYYIDYVEFAGGGGSGPSKAPIDLPINWDDTANVDYTVVDFGGNGSMLAADPNNASNIVLQSDKGANAQVWAGTSLGNSLASAIPFTATETTIKARVYSPTSGTPVRLKVEDQTNPAISVETEVMTTVVGWDTLSFDFSNHASGTAALNLANTYDKASIFYNFGTSPMTVETYYVDDVYFDLPPGKAPIDLPITWDDSSNVNYDFVDFGGNGSMLAADPNNASNVVLQSVKGANAQVWAGTSLGNALASAIPFTATETTIKARVYSPTSGTPVRLKVEDQTNPAISVETEVMTTVVGWDTLSFDFSNHVSGTAALNLANTYDKASIFYNFGTSPMTAETYYVDDVYFDLPPAKAPIDLPINWDDSMNVNYDFVDFGGNASMLAADPTNASNTVLQSDKTANAQVWAGTSLGNALASAIPFTATETTIKARVYSPTSGTPVRLKVEDQTNPGISVETEVMTTVVGWDTLSFDFSNHVSGTAALNVANTYDKASIFYNFGTSPMTAETYYVDDVYFDLPPAKAPIDLPINWDDSMNVNYDFVDFGGNASMLAADPTNASNTVLQSDKTANAQVWAGTSLGNALASAIPFSMGNTIITARVYSPTAGTPVRLKVEDQTNPAISVETEVMTTVVGWDTLSFDFSNHVSGTAAINFANTYDKASIFYNFGTSPMTAETYYLDDIAFGALSTGLNEIIAIEAPTLFPNPATNFITIDNNEQFKGNSVVEIINSVGQIVYSSNEILQITNRIDVSNLENGFYILSVQSEGQRSNSKFFISK